MTITFSLDAALEKQLLDQYPDLAQAAKESFLVQAFRDGRLTHHELALALALDRQETDAVLKRHRVTERSYGIEDLEADRATLERLLDSRRE
jgi:hypothetical protein